MPAAELIELWRGGLLEGTHRGHAVVCDERGEVIEAWGDPGAVIFPRSSCKMIQALPLIESGAAEKAGLSGNWRWPVPAIRGRRSTRLRWIAG